MQDFFDLIAAVRAGKIWTAVRIALKILGDYKDYLPVDGAAPVMSAAPDARGLDELIAQLELDVAPLPVATVGVSAAAVPWALLIPLVMEILKKLLAK